MSTKLLLVCGRLGRPGRLWALAIGLLGLVLLGGAAQAAKCPNLVIVLDKSGSMTESPTGGTAPPGGSKWDIAKAGLKDALATYDGKLPVGIALFGSDTGCGAARLDIAPDYGTAAKIGTLIDSRMPDSSTPTSESITAMSREATLHDADKTQYMLLLTDGLPNCATGEPDATVNAITAAHALSPSITTFVVGLGVLAAADSAAMDRMAVAGGSPSVGTPQKYYAATDLTTLKAVLGKIFTSIGGTGMCDDTSCYVTGCTRLTDRCILGMCRPNPCAGVSCPTNQYCYTDGVSAGTCLPDCPTACPLTKRCRGGTCVADPCGGFCGLATCDSGSHTCVPDSRCTGVTCKGTSRCLAGICTEDPCTLISCPTGTRCVAWEGTCEYDDGVPVVDMASGSTDMPGGSSDMAGGKTDMAGGKTDMAGGKIDMAGGSTDMASGSTDMAGADLAGWSPPDFSGLPGPDLSGEPLPPPVSGCSSAPGAASAASLFATFVMAAAFLLLRTRRRA